ncbi:Glutaredoxin 3 [Methylophaga frappieri]|uniref:Glutaredoxin n=1 Tax=Methylophaga frappieri (strain ATCC BAA-2434 / DSM 25690 / JAM7) TaxID=754477 RepID=I1YJQ7_METFJ|nr:glutaredoxin 3 [Methylophaga frappieri]AFJ03150.1 Glutaredoxin 3 [Methylophaga frappieri]
MSQVTIYSTAQCPYCVMAKQLLDRKGIAYNEIRIDESPEKRQEMMQKSQQRTVPQIFINDQAIGGYTDLVALDRANELDKMLA